MTNYQGVRRLKNYLKREYGVAPKDFGGYERYGGYERLYYMNDAKLECYVSVRAYESNVWMSFSYYDEDESKWISSRVVVISLEEFRSEKNENVVEDPVSGLPDNQEDHEADPKEFLLGKDKSLREKLPAPCNSCGFGHLDPEHLLSSSGMICSYGDNPCDFLINEGKLPCQGKWVI